MKDVCPVTASEHKPPPSSASGGLLKPSWPFTKPEDSPPSWFPDRGILLAATPIGNLGDASARLREALIFAPVIAAEDTRVVRRLASGLRAQAAGRLLSFHAHNTARRLPELLQLATSQPVLVVCDAGTPGVSDPGAELVAAAAAADIPITLLPGPSAPLAALVLSGLPLRRFCYEGFLPRSGAQRRRLLAEIAVESRTTVLLESPQRLAATLADLVRFCGPNRPAAVCRELTKLHEQVRRGTLAELLTEAEAERVRGEVCLVVGPRLAGENMTIGETPAPCSAAEAAASEAAASGVSASAAAALPNLPHLAETLELTEALKLVEAAVQEGQTLAAACARVAAQMRSRPRLRLNQLNQLNGGGAAESPLLPDTPPADLSRRALYRAYLARRQRRMADEGAEI